MSSTQLNLSKSLPSATTNTPRNLISLPNEIILEIGEFLESKALRHFIQTNTVISTILRPLLDKAALYSLENSMLALWYANVYEDAATVRLLLENANGIEVVRPEINQAYTSIHISPKPCSPEALAYVLEQGTELCLRNFGQHISTIQLACARRYNHMISFLLRMGAFLGTNTAAQTPLHIALSVNNIELVETLMDHGAAIDAWESGQDDGIFQLACEHGDPLCVAKLIEKGAYIDIARKEDGSSGLHIAVGRGHVAVVERLLSSRANINYINPFSLNSVLHLAVVGKNQKPEIVRLLLDKKEGFGVNLARFRNRDSMTAFELAERFGTEEIKQMVRKFDVDSINEISRGGLEIDEVD